MNPEFDPKSWGDLSPQQQRRLAGLAITLQEFVYGFDQVRKSEKGSATERFYSNSLYQYFCNIFLTGRRQSTSCFLKEIGSDDLIVSIDSILANQVGNQTIKYVIRAFRDKQLVHTLFTPEQLERHLRPDVHLDDSTVSEAIRDDVFKLFCSTYNLYDNLLHRFPKIRSHISST